MTAFIRCRPSLHVCSLVAMVLLLFGRVARSDTIDVDALIAFKSRITADPLESFRNWDSDVLNPCTWFHITCDDNLRVSRIDLPLAGLVGTLAPELGDLDALQYLELFGNHLTGTLPPELGKLNSLRSLDLFDNNLSGPIPQEFGQFAQPQNLKFLRLQNNQLTGSLAPALGSIALMDFNVTGNNLSGSLPKTFSRFSLDSFHPGNSGLCGGAPINQPCA